MAKDMAAGASHYITINGRRLWLDAPKRGNVRGFGGWSEQCEDCGQDIQETGTYSLDLSEVRCECGCSYTVKRA